MSGTQIHDDKDRRLSFERARSAHAIKIFEGQIARKEILEKKAEFYLSFVTLFLGAVFLSLDFLNALHSLLFDARVPTYWKVGITLLISTLACALFIALIAVLKCMQVRNYKNEYPDKTITSLFSPSSTYLQPQDESTLLKVTAESYVTALEHNSRENDEKARWVKVASYGVLAAVLLLAALLGVFVYLQLYVYIPPPPIPTG
jgi:hypothetical protein